jgi:hypothetical protein
VWPRCGPPRSLQKFPRAPTSPDSRATVVLGVHHPRRGERARDPLTMEQKIIKTKVEVLELAKQLGNVARACRIMATAGTASTGSRSCMRPSARWSCRRSRGPSRPLRNRVAPEIEAPVVELAVEQPAWGAAAGGQRAGEARADGVGRGGAVHLAAARPDDDDAPAQGAGSESGPRRAHPDRGPGGGAGDGGQGGPRGVREQVPGVLRGPGRAISTSAAEANPASATAKRGGRPKSSSCRTRHGSHRVSSGTRVAQTA